MSINLDDLTLGQIKQLNNLNYQQSTSVTQSMIGKYVIIRSRNEGINAGVVEAADETGVVLTEARRIWYHRPLDTKMSWYEGVAISGLANSSKLSPTVERKAIIEDYSIIQCTEIAEKSIREYVSNEQ